MAPRGPVRALTPRQLAIAQGIARGQTYAEIGKALGISPHTVNAHVRLIAVLFDPEREHGVKLTARQVIWEWMMFEQWKRGDAARSRG